MKSGSKTNGVWVTKGDELADYLMFSGPVKKVLQRHTFSLKFFFGDYSKFLS